VSPRKICSQEKTMFCSQCGTKSGHL